MKNVLLILAHPRGDASLSGAIAEAYVAGARRAGCNVKLLCLSALTFEPDVLHPSPIDQALEPDLQQAQRAIEAADHLVFVYPTWWGTYPARLKGFLDRVLLPGWAFEEIAGGTGFKGLLGGRTAELITTMDTPGPIYSVINKAPGRNALARATLGFCGIDVVRHTRFGPVNRSDSTIRKRWIARADALGARLSRGPLSSLQTAWRRIAPWLKALRLQFYPMTFFAYAMGALLAVRGSDLDLLHFAMGYLVLFALEAATVFGNEIGDEETDRLNHLWGPFNGGARTIVDEALSPATLRCGMAVALAVAAILGIALASVAAQHAVFVAFLALSVVLCLGYTMAPLKLSYRTFGEIDVALTHSFFAILFGSLVQGGSLADPAPWLASLPLFFSILPAIILSGIPDRDADAAAGKRTIAVAFGIRSAIAIGAASVLVALALMIVVELAALPGLYGSYVTALAALHAIYLLYRLRLEYVDSPVSRRIDATMIVALSHILWLCIPPLWRIGGL